MSNSQHTPHQALAGNYFAKNSNDGSSHRLNAVCIAQLISINLREHIIHTKSFQSGQFVIHKGDALKHLFIVQSGYLKTEYCLPNGQYSVNEFALPNDIFGFDGVASGKHNLDVIGLSNGEVRAIDHEPLLAFMAKEPEIHLLYEKLISQSFNHAQDHLFSLGNHTSEQKLAYFLRDFYDRQQAPHTGTCSLELPMGREDLKSYLGITMESLSRAFTSLENQHCFKVRNREITKIDFGKLQKLVE